VSGKDQ